MNAIQKERELAKSRMLEDFLFDGKHLVKLTLENVVKVEAMIQNDSDYIRCFDKDSKPVEKGDKYSYGGSTAYWMTCLKEYLLDGKRDTHDYEKIIKYAVEAIDRENSTHLNADKCGRNEITTRICNIDHEEFIRCLKNPEYKDMYLINVIGKKTSAKERARTNYSFASKFCHYACYFMFEGTEYQDNYSIYDSVLKAVMPLYLKYYEIENKYDLGDYAQYRMAVDAIRDETEDKISRNGFDHLLWYYHKGRLDELKHR